VVLGLIWAFSHHFIAGIRFLLLDLHVGAELAAARKSSALVLIVSLALTILLGVIIW
jgi:succinate dehydrogenase / fumarate reductase cytochrome b subunit